MEILYGLGEQTLKKRARGSGAMEVLGTSLSGQQISQTIIREKRTVLRSGTMTDGQKMDGLMNPALVRYHLSVVS